MADVNGDGSLRIRGIDMSRRVLLVVGLSAALGVTAYATGPTFRPDVIFKGSTLTAWTPIGAADWKAQNGEIVGTPKAPAGGWLVLNRSFEDVGVFSNITCDAGCKAGILLRAEKVVVVQHRVAA